MFNYNFILLPLYVSHEEIINEFRKFVETPTKSVNSQN